MGKDSAEGRSFLVLSPGLPVAISEIFFPPFSLIDNVDFIKIIHTGCLPSPGFIDS
jgi:hypothetical protein